jgi:hypothetical protein
VTDGRRARMRVVRPWRQDGALAEGCRGATDQLREPRLEPVCLRLGLRSQPLDEFRQTHTKGEPDAGATPNQASGQPATRSGVVTDNDD